MSTPDLTSRASFAKVAGCTLAYLDETIQLLTDGKWAPGDDVDRDAVVECIAGAGLAIIERLDDPKPVHKVDYSKGGSVFDREQERRYERQYEEAMSPPDGV